ncbi:acyltransferase family protein [Lacticaseibacillus paracasei]|uniref:acyltransferase family protein n=1 Tax=Lacticaseibacillus paracasei TaxID=1597 RepID=UPI0027395127|nr:acyltransferase family protein [Lacticaseibacillus paracasei]MDP4467183.1 acyltransferase family protein [Lacticaseibacillus paracasei]
MQEKKRVQWVDIAKGLTILLVVFGHALQGVVDSQSITLFSSANSLYIGKQIIYSFHMPLFFFLSGIFSQFIYRNVRVVVSSRVHRIVFPYFIWSLVLAICMQIASRYTTNGLGLRQFLLSPFIPFSEYWFLYVLFFIEMFYLLVHQIFPQRVLSISFAVGLGLFILIPFLPSFWILPFFSEYLVFFASATILSNELMKKRIRDILVHPLIIVGSLLLFIVSMFGLVQLLKMEDAIWLDYFLLVTSFLGGAFIIEVSMLLEKLRVRRFSDILSSLGRNSMKIYVMHLVPLAGLRIVFLRIFGVSQLWIVVLVTFMAAMLICWIGEIVISKLHLNAILFGQS